MVEYMLKYIVNTLIRYLIAHVAAPSAKYNLDTYEYTFKVVRCPGGREIRLRKIYL